MYDMYSHVRYCKCVVSFQIGRLAQFSVIFSFDNQGMSIFSLQQVDEEGHSLLINLATGLVFRMFSMNCVMKSRYTLIELHEH